MQALSNRVLPTKKSLQSKGLFKAPRRLDVLTWMLASATPVSGHVMLPWANQRSMAHRSKLWPVSTRSTGSLRRDFVIGQRNSLGQVEADAEAAGRVSLSVARAFSSACKFGSDALVDCAMLRKLLEDASGTLERTVFSCKPGQHAFLCKRRSWMLQSRAMSEQLMRRRLL
jgi:hypothetical protein